LAITTLDCLAREAHASVCEQFAQSCHVEVERPEMNRQPVISESNTISTTSMRSLV